MRFGLLFESDGSDFNFSDSLKELLGIDDDQVADILDRLDGDEIISLNDALSQGDVEAAKKVIGNENEAEGDDEGEEKKNVDGEDHEALATRLFSPKDKARAQKKKKAKILRKSEKELGEDTDPNVTFAIGDPVAVDGEEGTVKIPSADGDVVGVMINGDIKMVDKKNVHPLEEAVLGMTRLPGLAPSEDSEMKRIRELAGLRDEPAVADVPAAAEPAAIPPIGMDTPPVDAEFTDEPAPEMGLDDAMGDDMADDMGGDDMGDSLPAPAMGAPAIPAPPMGGLPDAGMAPPMPGAMDGNLEDAAALDQAISDIENMIPNVKLSEYKTLVARLKALVAMAESAGKAALTESSFRPLKKKTSNPDRHYDRVPPEEYLNGEAEEGDIRPYRKDRELEEAPLNFNMSAKTMSKPKTFAGDMAKSNKPSTLQDRISAFATNRRQKDHTMDESEFSDDDMNDQLADKEASADKKFASEYPTKEKKNLAKKDDTDVTRKTLMDYMKEAEGDFETIGMDRNTALKAVQARMGPNTSPQDANKAFDAMFAGGQIKQQNGSFQMPAMGDDDFKKAVATVAPSNKPTNGATAQSPAPSDDQGTSTGSNTVNPGANVQGAPNSAYQGR